MTDAGKKELSLLQRVLYSSGEMGVTLSPAIIVSWLLYFYTGRVDEAGNKIYLVGYSAFAALNFFGRIADSFYDPLIGYISDRSRSRWGRRLPWVIIGAPFLTFFYIALWYPPAAPGAWPNIVWLGLGLTGFWFFYTATVAPYLSLLPEVTANNDERIEISSYMAYGDVAGMMVATVLLGLMIAAGESGGLWLFPDGYKCGAWIIGLGMMICFWIAVAKVREKPHHTGKEVPFKFWEACRHCLRNPAFLPYVIAVSFFRLAADLLVAMIPFMVTVIMGFKEDVAGYLQGGIVVAALPLFPIVYKASAKYGKKKIFRSSQIVFILMLPLLATMKHFPIFGWAANLISGGGMSAGAISLFHVSALFLVAAYPISVLFVLPRAVLTDIIDLDAEHTGYRREAMYNGMEGLLTKFAAGIATIVAPMLLAFGGDTADRPWGILLTGPIAGFFLVLGYLSFRYYPIRK